MQADLALPGSTPMPAPLVPLKLTPPKPALNLIPAPIITAVPLLLFGRDERGRPHGARFAGNETAAVERAGALMGLRFVAAENQALLDLGTKLPAGRLFESGRGFVPFVKATLYDRLVAATGTTDAPRPAKAASKPAEAGGSTVGGQGRGAGGSGAGDPAGGGAPQRPTDWPEIGKGSHVLACEGPMLGWYEAIVVYTKGSDGFVLRWRDWPMEPEIVRARNDLGLLPLNSTEGMA